MNTSLTPANLLKQRALFEAERRKDGDITRDASGSYVNITTWTAWRYWIKAIEVNAPAVTERRFTTDDIKRVRDETAAGVTKCIKALTRTEGDVPAAIALLREHQI